jgi:hypothetical protein
MTNFIFKLAYTDTRCFYNIPPNWTVKYAFLRIRDYIVEDFGIDNTFELIHVDSIPDTYMCKQEEYNGQSNNFLDSADTIGNSFNIDLPNTFYIRHIECDNYETYNGRIERTV